MTTKADVLEAIEAHEVRFLHLWFTDITGRVKSVTIPAGQLDRALNHGVHFDGSSLESFARVAESDMLLIPDLDTFALLPWNSKAEKTARLICNVHTTNGDPFIGDPRAALIKLLKQVDSLGYCYKIGMELEFFLFESETLDNLQVLKPNDTDSYFDLPDARSQLVRQRMLSALDEMGVNVISAHHEVGSGHQEIDLMYSNALASADGLLTTRVVLKAIARQNNLHCTFMPRPSMSLPGSGMHIHQTLHDCNTDQNVFHDDDNQYGLSELAQQFLAGQLAHAPAMTAILAPLVNSYKRLGTSFEAPVYVTWAHINRSALIRVPGVRAGTEAHTRLELRLPDPSSNPYLAAVVMLQAGLEGIQQQMILPAPLEETLLQQNRARLRQVETLPNSLRQALEALEQDDVILSALGPYISDRYLAVKRQEYEAYSSQVTRWELEQYFEQY